MSIGKSGRIVIEVDPDIKHELYKHLNEQDRSLKSWFLEHAERFVAEQDQPKLELISPKRGKPNEV